MEDLIAGKLKKFLLENGFSPKTSVEVRYKRDKNPLYPEVEITIRGTRHG